MSGLLGQRAFSVGGTDYTWADVVLAAVLRGDWGELTAAVRRGLACVDHAAATGRLGPNDDGAAAAEFRYARGLLSAEETRAWLARWDVSPRGWMAYVRRARLRDALAGELAVPGALDRVDGAAVAECVMAEGACSGMLLRLARRLAARAAVVETEPADDEAVRALAAELPRALAAEAPPGLDVARCVDRASIVVRAELALYRFRERVVTPGAVGALIAARRLEWTLLDYRAIAFPDAGEAAEAALCVREDGDSLRQVAAVSGRPLLETSAFLGETDLAVRDHLLGAAERDVVGPLVCGGEHVLFELLRKRAPSPDDPDVARRAERLVLGRALRRAMDDRVRWDDWP